MKKSKLILVCLSALSGLMAALRPQHLTLANSGFVGVWRDGCKTLPTAAVTTGQHRLLKLTDTGTTWTQCGTTDIPIAFTEDHSTVAGDLIEGRLLGVYCDTAIGTASGAITANDQLVAGANGTVRTLPATTGTYYIIDRALESAADTAQVPFAHCFPIQRVVP